MYIVLIFQLALAELFTIKKEELKTLFALPINGQDFELQTNNDEWNVCQLQEHQLKLQYTQYDGNNKSNLAMLSLSQHSILVLTDDRQINYFQDQILFWQYEIPTSIDIQNATMRYCQVTYLVYFISNQVYRFNPYDKNFQEFEMFLNYQPQQIEICDQYIFVLNQGLITIYSNNDQVYQIQMKNSDNITHFAVINNSNKNGYNIYILDKQTGLQKIEWNLTTHTITQLDLIQNGLTMGISNESNIYVAYKRQYKYIIAQYQIIDSQLQIVRKLQSKKKIQKIIAFKEYTLFLTSNKIDLLYENKIYKILKFGIKDIQIIGNKIMGISFFDIFQYQFEPIPNSVQCFYHLDEEIPYALDYSLTFNEINKTIHKKRIEFSVEVFIHKSNTMKIVLGFLLSGILLMLILSYTFLTLKQKNLLINEMESNLKKFKVKQVPLFKSLECVISPKGQHSKLQSFDQTSNFDLNKVRN
ncbi:unnamed protein product [Paramecium octaurelia]|uniref:Transmembrane protein n=1 Tax=Paramecium octaurelia TaxID=43137 RepID=A0A8S1X813_PAROT|nr:unnamed protein product [Paramecium octaurelia]